MKFSSKSLLAGLLAGLFLAGGAIAQVNERNIKFSIGLAADHPQGLAVQKFGEIVSQKSGGKMKVQGFWSNSAGNDMQATMALRAGTQEMCSPSTSPLVGMVKELGVFDLPFLFANEKEADTVLDGAAGKYFTDKLTGIGLVNLAYWENGFRNTTNSRHPITKFEDFQGVKMRVMQNNIFLDTFSNMGANAVPMAFSELFTALETKAVDGQENPFVTIDSSKFFEVQKYLSVTRHAYTPFLVLFSKKLWDGYTADEQKILREAALEARDYQRKVNRELSDKTLTGLKAKGMLVNDIAYAEQVRMREKAKAVYEKHAKNIGDEPVRLVFGELDKLRAKK